MELLHWGILALYLGSVAVMVVYGAHRFSLLWAYRQARRPEAVDLSGDSLPMVTVQLPMYNERLVVRRVIEAASALDYPADKLQIQVLDDSTDETTDIAREAVAEARAQGVDITLVRRGDRQGYKAGALAHGLETAKGEFLALLDADFVVPRDFLRRALPHFTDGVGMVQARWGHLNRDQTLLTALQAVLLDAHFVVEQAGRAGQGLWFHFNGTCGIWRRSCLEEAGGWEFDTLTEDLDLSYRAEIAGWRFVFLPDLEVPGELPDSMEAFKVQQSRWAKGGVQTALKLKGRIWRSRASMRIKIEAAAHLSGNLSYLALLVLVLVLPPSLWARMHVDLGWLTLLDPLVFVLATASVASYFAASQAGVKGRFPPAIRVLGAMALGLGLAFSQSLAVWEGVRGGPLVFERTPKSGGREEIGRQPYLSRKSGTAAVERALLVYYLGATFFAASMGAWRSVPLFVLIGAGFGMVGMHGLFRDSPVSSVWKKPRAEAA